MQWNAESEKLQRRIAEIEIEISRASSGRERARLESSRAELAASVPRLGNLRWDRITVACALYAIGLVPPSFLLHRALWSLGQRPRLGTSIAAQLLGHVGKYVPGKAMVIVIRAGALSRDGVRAVPATISIFLETFLMMAVGAVVAGIVVLWLPVPRWISAAAAGAAVLASLPTLPPILKRVAAKVAPMDPDNMKGGIGFKLCAAGWGWSTLSWVLIGASFSVLITAIPGTSEMPPWYQLYAIATASISLAVVLGFASLIPGGAGVRELVLTTVLGVSLGAVHGILAAIAARIMFIAVEAMLATGAWAWLRRT